MSADGTSRVAIVQKPSIPLDRDGTIKRAIEYFDEAVDGGAALVVFPETFIPGYPDWAWMIHPAMDWEIRSDIYERLLENAVDIGRGDLQPLQDRAREHGVTVVVGMHERSPDSRTSLYNSLVTITHEGAIGNVHRKLVPTFVERNVWSPGDGAGLRVLDTPVGRIGGLICWENLMPLARFALYAQGIDIYVVSTFDSGDESIATMQHIAREASCWVVCSGVATRLDDVPADFPHREAVYGRFVEAFPHRSEWLKDGDSLIVAPSGKIVEGPMRGEYGILFGDLDPKASRRERWSIDVAGHYNRPDVFDLTVDRNRLNPIAWKGNSASVEESRSGGDLVAEG